MPVTTARSGSSMRRGLTAAEVERSRQTHGANLLTPPVREPWWVLYLEKFNDPVIRILIIAAVIATVAGAYHGDWVEGIGIMIAIVLSTFLGFYNEYRANAEFDLLNKVNDEVPVKVIRDGAVATVPRKDIVVGDLVLVELGEEVPADGSILEAVNLHVDESRLTGESVPVAKFVVGHAPAVETAYPPDKLLRGTLVADGRGMIEITAVGDHTDIGKTARAAAEATNEKTPLTKQLQKLSKLIGIFGLGFAVLTFFGLLLQDVLRGDLRLTGPQWLFTAILFTSVIVGLIRVWLPMIYDAYELLGKDAKPPAWLENEGLKGWLATLLVGAALFAVGVGVTWLTGLIPAQPSDWLPAGDPVLHTKGAGEKFLKYFMYAITIIVVAVPEGLAMSVTLSLAYSMRRMAANNNLVRHMHACETIGAATVICSDKTGTLTMNEMRVHAVDFPAKPESTPQRPWPQTPLGSLLTEAIAANTTAHLTREAGRAAKVVGNPTEGALLLWLDQEGVDYAARRQEFTIAHQWTFSTERKFMATLGNAPGMAGKILHVKGAPEIIMARCTRVLTPQGKVPLGPETKAQIEVTLRDLQARGMRTLGFAYDDAPKAKGDEVPLEQLADKLVWLGFVAIADPVRSEVPPAVAECDVAGVAVKMVTGDNPATAREIARQIKLWNDRDTDDHMLTGPEFQALPDEEARKAVSDLKVMARARPMDKLRLVRLLKEQKHVVAVTGDGTNDAPALNYADVGLAMGKTGTAVAKEASDIILLDDSFNSIVTAIMWGRSLYQNIQRFLLFQLTINVSALSIAFFAAFNGAQPLTIMQLLWVNLIMDTFAALALATEPPDWDVMKRKPRHPDDFIITPAIARGILGVGAIFVVLLLGLLAYYLNQGHTQFGPGPKDAIGLKYDDAKALLERTADERRAAGGAATPGQIATWERMETTARTVMHDLSFFFTFYVMLQFWNLFNARRLGSPRSIFDRPFENPYFWTIAGVILCGQIVITQLGGEIFQTSPLGLTDWLLILAVSSMVLWIGEVWRAWHRQRGSALPAR